MKVWIVMQARTIDGVDCTSVVSVFSSQEKADQWIDSTGDSKAYFVDDYEVDEPRF